MPHGLFISYRPFIDGRTGGVQACTREYLEVIRAAGVDLSVVTFDGDRRLSTRLLRRIDSSPYLRPAEPSLFDTVRSQLERGAVDFIFLNQVALAGIAGRLRSLAPGPVRFVLLSHGLESTDLLHLLRLRGEFPLSGRVRPSPDLALGRVIRAEAASRRNVDAVFALSPFDVELERWMGTAKADWLPRIVTPEALDWRPAERRLGFVGTLDHAPNLEGLVLALDALIAQPGETPRIRIVGGPGRIGAWLADRYPSVDFLGGLDDGELAHEAATWAGFLHPIFCHPRGCSTKLAMAIGWQIPIVTTPPGRRGYVWREGSLLEADGPAAFARDAMSLFDPAFAAAARAEVVRVAATSPTVADVASRVRGLLDLSDEAHA